MFSHNLTEKLSVTFSSVVCKCKYHQNDAIGAFLSVTAPRIRLLARLSVAVSFLELTGISPRFFEDGLAILSPNDPTTPFLHVPCELGPILTIVFPKFSPLKRAIKAFGAFSRPSNMVSFNLIFPSLTP